MGGSGLEPGTHQNDRLQTLTPAKVYVVHPGFWG